jgi:tetratricopeptide (TPR) repeat protein
MEAEIILAPALSRILPSPIAADLAQNLAVAQNKLGKQVEALASIARAQGLDPQRRLDALKGEVLACLHRFDEALPALERAIAASPQDAGLHKKYNDLLYMLGRDGDAGFLSSYDRVPADEGLQVAKAGFLLMARRDAQAYQLFMQLLARNPVLEPAVSGAATALNMMGRHDEAAALLDQALHRAPHSPGLLNGQAVTALHQKDPAKAAAMAQKAVTHSPHYQYALANLGTAWRLMNDPRDEALNGYDSLVRAFDLEPPDGFSSMADFNAALALELAALHPPVREFPDQSLRGGTQTRGSLFGAALPLVALLKPRLDQAVASYIAGLRADAAHPLLSRRSVGFAYSGSWSSRLSDQGFHVNHIHPEQLLLLCVGARCGAGCAGKAGLDQVRRTALRCWPGLVPCLAAGSRTPGAIPQLYVARDHPVSCAAAAHHHCV